MPESNIPDACPNYLTSRQIKDAITMWIEDQNPSETELDDLSVFLHKKIFEAFGGKEDEGFSRTTLELKFDGDVIAVTPDMWLPLDGSDAVEIKHTERSLAAKLFQLIMKELKRDAVFQRQWPNREQLLLEMDETIKFFKSSDSAATRKIYRKALLILLFADELRYDNEG